MKKKIIASLLFLMTVFCFGQNVDETETIELTQEEISTEEEVFMDDFISFRGKQFTIAMMDETSTYMVAKKHLEREIGVVEEFIEDAFEKISTDSRIVSCSWDKGTKLYKIKQIDENKYIAVEWADATSGNKYYVYYHQKDADAEQQLQKFVKEMK